MLYIIFIFQTFNFIAHYTISFVVGYVFTLVVDAPCTTLFKHLLDPSKLFLTTLLLLIYSLIPICESINVFGHILSCIVVIRVEQIIMKFEYLLSPMKIGYLQFILED